MKMSPTNEPEEKSEFNIAIAGLYRINDLLTSCAMESARRNFLLWGNSLFALCREINYLFTEEETKKDKEFKRKLNPLLTEFETKMIWDNENRRYFCGSYEPYKNYGILNYILDQYEMFLRNALQKRDMLNIHKADLKKAVSDM
jgi:predicted MPP superfamily phosphohydrolase